MYSHIQDAVREVLLNTVHLNWWYKIRIFQTNERISSPPLRYLQPKFNDNVFTYSRFWGEVALNSVHLNWWYSPRIFWTYQWILSPTLRWPQLKFHDNVFPYSGCCMWSFVQYCVADDLSFVYFEQLIDFVTPS